MKFLLEAYPYLFGSLALLGLSAVGFWLLPDQRRPMLLSGLLAAPFALASIELVPEYWNPVRVAVFLIGPEDVIFTIAAGLLAWSLAVFPLHRRLVLDFHLREMLRPLAFCLFLGFVVHVVCRLGGVRGIQSHMVPAAVVGAVLLVLRPSLWPIPLVGALFFPPVYLSVPLVLLRLRPDFLLQWNAAHLSGVFLFGVPGEEALWALGYGAFWPLLVAFVLGGELRVSRAQGSAAP